jgi:hypothetical protein
VEAEDLNDFGFTIRRIFDCPTNTTFNRHSILTEETFDFHVALAIRRQHKIRLAR